MSSVLHNPAYDFENSLDNLDQYQESTVPGIASLAWPTLGLITSNV